MSRFDVHAVQRVHEFEARDQHVFSDERETTHLINDLARRIKQAICNGAGRLWRWCSSLVTPSSRGHPLKQMDRQMLSLHEKEQRLTETLTKTERAMQLVPVGRWQSKGFGAMEYLQTVKARAALELQEVNDQRIATVNKTPFGSNT